MSSLSNLTIHSIGGGWGKDVEDEGLELVAVIRGTDIPNLEINNIQGVPFRYETQKKIQSRLLQIGDLVIEISGGSASSKQRTGRCLYITDELLKNLGGKVIPASFCKLLRLDRKKVNSKYVYYQIKAMHLSDEIASFENQSTGISNFQFNRFIDEIRPSILDIEVQNKIVNFLEKIDLKIINNININQTLEQIAQTIFKSWFIDFDPVHAKANALASGQAAEQATQAAMAVISGKNTQELHRLQTANPEQYQQLWEIAEAFPSGVDEEGVPRGWGQTTLSEVCSMKNGYAFKSSDWTDEGIPVIKIGSVKPMIVEVDGNGFVDEEHSVLHSEFLLTEGDIVVGLTGYVGEVGRIPQGRTAMLNQRVAKFIPNKLNEQQDYYSFVYCLVRDKSFKAFAETNAKGSAQANISTKELLNYSIILASSEIQMKFESLIKPLLDKILVNSGNNENLSKVRDLLLPKLLSGEIHL
ncbi:restriction endonuclease subunit S [Glaesserella parasuis]|uniref:restriction endonuclease subunit S n=1 Tax=Glaesserella parasuis TaxID=738 RepID=UPI0027183CF3|nr:restriction endonuclease subunit S [Glaesserella parasuis]MDO9678643.1 restriction endonuclease subunit S [Glaesserella parasuis]MDO9688312.1 restriction endonuclease subunit S [Glaesserella parasuis]MDO9697475.1 restriction endonuclease subunit S [Glaesserella parasuis]MDO9992459.1 restriction endonuclease subunit S [Glaesserella parasuis]